MPRGQSPSACLRPAIASYWAWLDSVTRVTRASWRNPRDVKASYPKASILKAGRVVFNIKGNDYRLVAAVQYRAGAVAIRFFGSHAEYDEIRGDSVMDATLIVIDTDAELARARALVDRLWDSEDPADIARLRAQAHLIAAYEESRWPRRPPATAENPAPYGSARAYAVRHGSNPRNAEQSKRGLGGQEGAEHGHGAAVACSACLMEMSRSQSTSLWITILFCLTLAANSRRSAFF